MELGVSMDDGGTGAPATNASISTPGQFFGDVDELRDILAPVLAVVDPSSQMIEGTSFAAATDELKAAVSPDAFLGKCNYLSAPIPDDGIGELINQMGRFPEEGRSGELKIFSGVVPSPPSRRTRQRSSAGATS